MGPQGETAGAVTVGEALAQQEERHFVGRAAEIEAFSRWLDSDSIGILTVTAPGGFGKTSLLGAFARIAEKRGRQVVSVDALDLDPTPEGLVAALGGASLDDAIEQLNERRPLVTIDTFEQMQQLGRFLSTELLPRLTSGVKVVIAGRAAPREVLTGPWRGVVQSLDLPGLVSEESRAYLRTRGIDDPEVEKSILDVAGGLPLALSLAADMALEMDVSHFGEASEWHLVVRSLVDTLLRDIEDEDLRELLLACCVLRHFDEETLAAIVEKDVSAKFGLLCRLSAVRTGERGLKLHDDVRKVLEEDFKWRAPMRHDEFRRRALAHYYHRAQSADAEEKEWLLRERVHLWEHDLVRSLFLEGEEPDRVWVEPAGALGVEEVVEVERAWQSSVLPALGEVGEWDPGYGLEEHLRQTELLVSTPGARIRIVRNSEGEAVGSSVWIKVFEESARLLIDSPLHGALLRAYISSRGGDVISSSPDESNIHFLVQVGLTGIDPTATKAALLRDAFSVLARGEVYLAVAVQSERQRIATEVGLEPFEGSEVTFRGRRARGYLLDLTGVGVDAWMDAFVGGRPLPRAMDPPRFEEELKNALVNWEDDKRLAGSPLAAALISPEEAGRDGAEVVRHLITGALARLRESAAADEELAYRALELAYLNRNTSHETAAERLAVSRSTFYRLLRRGVKDLAAALNEG